VEFTISDDAWRKSGDGCTRAYSHAARDLTGSGISDGGSAQDGEILSGAERLRLSMMNESRQRRKGKEES
jgi:hypothetical protein